MLQGNPLLLPVFIPVAKHMIFSICYPSPHAREGAACKATPYGLRSMEQPCATPYGLRSMEQPPYGSMEVNWALFSLTMQLFIKILRFYSYAKRGLLAPSGCEAIGCLRIFMQGKKKDIIFSIISRIFLTLNLQYYHVYKLFPHATLPSKYFTVLSINSMSLECWVIRYSNQTSPRLPWT